MKTVEKTGKTVEEAVEEALKELDADREQVDIEILEGGNKGLFGILGGKQARVKVFFKGQDRPVEEIETQAVETEASDEEPEAASAAVGERDGDDSRIGDQEATPDHDAVPVDRSEDATTFLQNLLEVMKIKAEVRTTAASTEQVDLEISGADLGVVIGRRGQTLDAIQYLVGLVINNKGEEWTRVLVDAQGYRKRREETLRSLAVRMARKVKTGGRKLALEPMSSQERRIIHMALQDLNGVTTYSEGEEPFRRVIIAPR